MSTAQEKLLLAQRLLDDAASQVDVEEKLTRIANVRKDRVLCKPELGGRWVSSLETLIEEGQRFGTVYADPPWQYANSSSRGAAETHYRTMPVGEIASLPISRLAADNAHLHLWTTNSFLFEAKAVMESWGFAYKSCLVWIKPQLGNGNYWRLSHEFLLLGVRGSLSFSDKSQQSWIFEDRSRHSEKPAIFRRLVERVSPGPRLELFARTQAEAWTSWGDQIERDLFAGLEE